MDKLKGLELAELVEERKSRSETKVSFDALYGYINELAFKQDALIKWQKLALTKSVQFKKS